MRDMTGFVAASPLTEMSKTEYGLLAEDLVYYRLRRHGLDVYRPMYPKAGVDLLVSLDGNVRRCQVKATVSAKLDVSIRYSGYKDGKYRQLSYADGNVDYFFLVDLIHEHVFVVPVAEQRKNARRSVTLTQSTWVWALKDAYHLIS